MAGLGQGPGFIDALTALLQQGPRPPLQIDPSQNLVKTDAPGAAPIRASDRDAYRAALVQQKYGQPQEYMTQRFRVMARGIGTYIEEAQAAIRESLNNKYAASATGKFLQGKTAKFNSDDAVERRIISSLPHIPGMPERKFDDSGQLSNAGEIKDWLKDNNLWKWGNK